MHGILFSGPCASTLPKEIRGGWAHVIAPALGAEKPSYATEIQRAGAVVWSGGKCPSFMPQKAPVSGIDKWMSNGMAKMNGC